MAAIRLLFDHNVDERYVQTFRDVEWATVMTVREALGQNAPDDEIGAFAQANDWVVFSGDDDFERDHFPFGVIRYHQYAQPAPGAVREAVQLLSDVYDDHRTIYEFVPGNWV